MTYILAMLTLKINISCLESNLCYLRKRVSCELCAVVKGNAYGHGLAIAHFIDDYIDSYAVANGDEAIKLRKITSKPIYVLCPSEDINDDNVIYAATSEKDFQHKRVCVKVNTGMNRLGILPSEVDAFLDLCVAKGIKVDSIYTHFSDFEYAPIQFDRFMNIDHCVKRHACASNFLKLPSEYQLDMVRCGLAMYGYGDEHLKPVMSAYTEVYAVLSVKKGERIGYSYVATNDMKIAVLGAGYADGIRRQKQMFCIKGKLCETVGNICMDMCFVNVSDIDVQTGDKAEFLGKNIDGICVANNNNTIIYEILTSFGSRPRRIYE